MHGGRPAEPSFNKPQSVEKTLLRGQKRTSGFAAFTGEAVDKALASINKADEAERFWRAKISSGRDEMRWDFLEEALLDYFVFHHALAAS